MGATELQSITEIPMSEKKKLNMKAQLNSPREDEKLPHTRSKQESARKISQDRPVEKFKLADPSLTLKSKIVVNEPKPDIVEFTPGI